MKAVFILVGSPSSGKTWVSNQLKDQYEVVEHDAYRDKVQYMQTLIEKAKHSTKPILANTPFGLSQIMEYMGSQGVECKPVFIIESPEKLISRYYARESKPIPKGHLTRQHTYQQRAYELGAFHGTSTEVLAYLKKLATK